MSAHRSLPVVRIGATAWMLSSVFFVVQVLAQIAFNPAYSLLDDLVSDLGNTTCGAWQSRAYACSPLHDLVNATFVATGVLLLAGAVLTWPAWPHRKLTVAGLSAVIVAGLGYVLVGLNPEDINAPLHIAGASNLFFSNLALVLLGLATLDEHSWRSTPAVIVGCIGFVTIALGPPLFFKIGHGGGLAERVVLYPLVAYLVAVGGSLWRQSGYESRAR